MANDLHVICANGHWVMTDNHASPGSALSCPPGEGCCEEDHDHEAAAACPADHSAEPCPTPESCMVYAGGYVAPSGNPEDFSGPMVKGSCPGGHCAPGVSGCNVCRPVTITGLPGLFGSLQPATGGTR